MSRGETLLQSLQALRFDGAAWRRLAAEGSAQGPEWLKRHGPGAIAALLFLLVGAHRRGATRNLQQVLHTDRGTARRAAFGMFREFARCTSEAMEQTARPDALRLDRPLRDPVAHALRKGRGAVVATAHFGGWQVAARALADLGRPVNVVMAREPNPTTREQARTASPRPGVHVVFADASVFASLALIRALERNEIVAVQLDRMLGRAGARPLPFLGAPAPFPSGPFVLARLSRAPVIPVFAPRLGRRHYRLEFGRPVHVPRETRAPGALDDAMREGVRPLEEAVRARPLQWFRFTPFWPEAGEGDPEAAVREASVGRGATAQAAWEPAERRGIRRL